MSKRLFRAMVLGSVATWLLVGMSLSRLLTILDAGGRPELNQVLVVAFLGITGLLNALALLQLPIPDTKGIPDAPAA